jgi:SAM-dependent methyltransferase
VKQLPWLKRPYFPRRILEIGPGHNPFKGVTHLLEMDVNEGRERGGNVLFVPDSAKLIVGEATSLPFGSGTFDYVYASHVLEHVEQPEQACREIMRVGRAGYIETPSPFLEQGMALRDETSPEHWFHRWFVFSLGPDRLVFEPKTPEQVRWFCSCEDGQFLREFYGSLDFRDAQHCFRRKAKTTTFYWTGGFSAEVRRTGLDCRQSGRPCRFAGMRKMLVDSCRDVFRSHRVLRLKRQFPDCRAVFRKYGHATMLIG